MELGRPRAKLGRGGEADRVGRRLPTGPPGARRERLLAVPLGLQGELGLERIAQAEGRARATLQTWFDTYRQGGVAAPLHDSRSDNPGRPGELSGAALAELRKDPEAGRWRRGPQPQRWLAQTHGVKLAVSSLHDRLGKVGARLRGPRRSHGKKNPGLPGPVRVLTLPAHSPELNPIAGLWDQPKDRLGNRAFDTPAELEAVLRRELQRSSQDARRSRSPVFDRLPAQANASSRPVIPLCQLRWYETA